MKPEMLFGVAAVSLMSFLSAACTSADTTTASAAPAAARTSIENSCINPTEITKQKVLSDAEIQFELRNGEVWVNRLPRVCPGLKIQQGFSWDVRGSLVCSNQETIRVKDEGTPCMLGEFVRLSSERG